MQDARCRALDWIIAAALTLGGVATRAPHLALIPVFEDEVGQTLYALSIRPGEFMPLVGNDPYAGPLFSYILAVSLRVLGASPVAPRIVVMVMGSLTVGLVYGLARTLGLGRPWAALAGLMLAANPHHILINSHYAGTTYALPLFSTAFLLALVLAVKRSSGGWLVASGALLGLAAQTNPVVGLMLPGVAVWFLLQRQPAIGLRTRWPYLAAVAFLLAYAPVIASNLQTSLAGVQEAGARSYLWQPNPSWPAYLQNLWRLALQLCRQVSGVLEGAEDLATLVGLPLLFSAWAVLSLIYAARRGNTLPALAVGSHLLVMPWLSNHYGLTGTTRFTNQLTPLILIAMAALAAGVWALARQRIHPPGTSRFIAWLAGVLLLAAGLWPLTHLFRYYEHAVARGETNAPALAFAGDFVQQWRGDPILLSSSMSDHKAIEYLLAVNRVPYTMLPIGRIMEMLATGQDKGALVLIMTNTDRPRVQSQADLTVWNSPVMQASRKLGYGAYTIQDAQVRKPTFVFADATLAPAVQPVQANLADQLSVIGFEARPESVAPGAELVVNVHWQAAGAMPEAYTGFVHLVAPDGRLAAQDDHELGRGFYRTLFWQPGEVIRERYALLVPGDAPAGRYTLWVGAYNFPSLNRLPVRSASTATRDDIVALGSVQVGP